MKEFTPPPGSIPTMEVPSLEGISAVHLVGIGGAGMSGIARLLLVRGMTVTGSDLKDSPGLELLRAAGASIEVGHRPENLPGVDAVVVSTAIRPENPEVRAARERGIPVLARAQVLAALMRERRGIAVAGTHGKTTTTSMLAVVLERAGLDPTYVIGGDLNESGSNARAGAGDLFLAEADESDGSFLLLRPEVAVVTNVEEDHHDFYSSRDEVESAFRRFCEQAQLVVACGEDQGAVRAARESGVRCITYGEGEHADVRLVDPAPTETGGRGTLLLGETRVSLEIPLPGRHYLLNGAAVVAAARVVGVAPETTARALRAFAGVHRRFERRGVAAGATFVDDYAHHPTEIEATLGAARAEARRRLVAVFQPHRFSRTAALWRDLGRSLHSADVVVVTDVYGAGEMPVPGVSGKLVVESLLDAVPRKRAVYLPSRADVAPFLASEVREGDLVLTLGAGDITMVGEETMGRLREGGR